MSENENQTRAPNPHEFGIRWLTPEHLEIFRDGSRIDCRIEGKDTYHGTHAKLMFPVKRPKDSISPRYSDEKGRVKEIGVIAGIADFPSAAPGSERTEKALLRTDHSARLSRRSRPWIALLRRGNPAREGAVCDTLAHREHGGLWQEGQGAVRITRQSLYRAGCA